MRPIILRGVDAGVKIHSHRAGTLDNATIDSLLAALRKSVVSWAGGGGERDRRHDGHRHQRGCAECDHHGRRAVPRFAQWLIDGVRKVMAPRAWSCQNFSTTVAWSRSGGPVVCTVRISPMPRAKYLFSPGALGSSRSESFVTSRFLTGPVSGVVSLPVRSRTSPVSSATPFAYSWRY